MCVARVRFSWYKVGMANEKAVVAYGSNEAAHKETVTGWVSRSGHFWGDDEHMARWDGCTHVPCEDCGVLLEKMCSTVCRACEARRDVDKFAKLPREEWNGIEPLFSESCQKYLWDAAQVRSTMEAHGCSFDELMPRLCERVTAHRIDRDDFCDELPEDDQPDELVDAIEAFNKAMDGVTLSWRALDIVATWDGATALESAGKEGK